MDDDALEHIDVLRVQDEIHQLRFAELRPRCAQLQLPVPRSARAAHYRGLLRQHAAYVLPVFQELAAHGPDPPAGKAYHSVGF
eukprot:88356-Amphidinium_carterae.1